MAWLRSLYVVLPLMLQLGPGCAATQERAESPLEYAKNAKLAYEEALDAFFDEDWVFASQLMTDVSREYAYSRYGRLAELRLADIAFRQSEYADAISKYKAFVHDYPNDPEVPYARYKIAAGQYNTTGESALLPPLEERDLAGVIDAFSSLSAYLKDYPESKYGRELRYKLDVVRGLLVRHELYVARYYLGKDNFRAAIYRAEYAVKHYSESGLEPEALVLLGETYLKLKDRKKARLAFNQVLTHFPESPFTRPAKNFLERLGPEIAQRRVQ